MTIIAPGNNKSYWIASTPETNYPSLDRDIQAEVAIIGSGIVGLTTAFLLTEAGLSTTLIDMQHIINGETGYTTAKVTSLHGIKYRTLIKNFSSDHARLYADANQAAIEFIANTVNDHRIACDFIREDAYTIAMERQDIEDIDKEVEATQKLGLPAAYTTSTSLPFDIEGAIKLENQAHFHPRKYLLALTALIQKSGGQIYENTRALKVSPGNPTEITTDKGTIKADHVVIATTFPILDTGLFYTRLYPYRFYALGIRIKGETPTGMYYSIGDDTISIRTQPTPEGTMLIVGGGRNKTGQGGDIIEQYKTIEKTTKRLFDVSSLDYFWSTEDYHTPDEAPYIGRIPKHNNIYMAAGFGGWGMTNGTASAMLIRDQILKKENHWFELFNPSRHELASYGTTFISEGANVTAQFAKNIFIHPKEDQADHLALGEGKIMKVDNKKVAVYKNEDGSVKYLHPNCPHLGCTVSWDNAERTWDCTCHGSRYLANGKLIHGPSTEDLREDEM